MASELAKFIDYEPSHFENSKIKFKVGNSLFENDVWDFKNLIKGSENWPDNKCWLKFDNFKHISIKNTVKWFMVTELRTNGFNTVKRKLAALNSFNKYLEVHSEITSFNDINKYRLEEFFYFVLADKKENGEQLSAISKKKSAQVIKEHAC